MHKMTVLLSVVAALLLAGCGEKEETPPPVTAGEIPVTEMQKIVGEAVGSGFSRGIQYIEEKKLDGWLKPVKDEVAKVKEVQDEHTKKLDTLLEGQKGLAKADHLSSVERKLLAKCDEIHAASNPLEVTLPEIPDLTAADTPEEIEAKTRNFMLRAAAAEEMAEKYEDIKEGSLRRRLCPPPLPVPKETAFLRRQLKTVEERLERLEEEIGEIRDSLGDLSPAKVQEMIVAINREVKSIKAALKVVKKQDLNEEELARIAALEENARQWEAWGNAMATLYNSRLTERTPPCPTTPSRGYYYPLAAPSVVYRSR